MNDVEKEESSDNKSTFMNKYRINLENLNNDLKTLFRIFIKKL